MKRDVTVRLDKRRSVTAETGKRYQTGDLPKKLADKITRTSANFDRIKVSKAHKIKVVQGEPKKPDEPAKVEEPVNAAPAGQENNEPANGQVQLTQADTTGGDEGGTVEKEQSTELVKVEVENAPQPDAAGNGEPVNEENAGNTGGGL